MEIQCPSCSDTNVSVLGEYKFNVESDRHFFGSPNLSQCSQCELVFAWPMPDLTSLEEFYTNIYRAKGRPHFFDLRFPPQPNERHFSYISTLSSAVNIQDIRNVLEIGPGAGEIGMLLKAANPHVTIYCIEPDLHSQEILRERGYTPTGQLSEIPHDLDLVMAFHSLEHFTSVDGFVQLFEQRIKRTGVLFLEVPNCPTEHGFLNRPYDSPHLLFFNARSLSDSLARRGFTEINVHTSGHTLSYEFGLGENWLKQYSSWKIDNPKPKLSVGLIARKLTPISVRKRIQGFRRSQQAADLSDRVQHHMHNRSDAWLLRGVFTPR